MGQLAIETNNGIYYRERHDTTSRQINEINLIFNTGHNHDHLELLPPSQVWSTKSSALFLKGDAIQKRKTAVPRSMVVKALMSCEDGA